MKIWTSACVVKFSVLIKVNDFQLWKKGPPSTADKEEAERMKTEGNLMRTEKYSEAIGLDRSNPVFYCNCAVAHSKMNNCQLVIEDCQRAIDMDPQQP